MASCGGAGGAFGHAEHCHRVPTGVHSDCERPQSKSLYPVDIHKSREVSNIANHSSGIFAWVLLHHIKRWLRFGPWITQEFQTHNLIRILFRLWAAVLGFEDAPHHFLQATKESFVSQRPASATVLADVWNRRANFLVGRDRPLLKRPLDLDSLGLVVINLLQIVPLHGLKTAILLLQTFQ